MTGLVGARFLETVEKQAIRNLHIVESISALYEVLKLKFGNILASEWSVQVLDFLFTNPVFRNNKFTNNSGIPPAVAARFSQTLLEVNLIDTLQEASDRRPA